MSIKQNTELSLACEELLAAMLKVRKLKHNMGNAAGVHWIEYESGEVIIFTLSEYKTQLMQNINPAWPETVFDIPSIEEPK